MNNFKESWGVQNRLLFTVTLSNLDELEFLGLKIILEEEPKITQKNEDFLKREIYFARDSDGSLFLYFGEPIISHQDKNWDSEDSFYFKLDTDLFPFITWESEKFWSRSELLKLGVKD